MTSDVVLRRYSMRWPITDARTPLDQLLAAATQDLLGELSVIGARPASPPGWRLSRPGGWRLHLVCDVEVEMAREAARRAS